MKKYTRILLATAASALFATLTPAQAQNIYYDTNGTTAGFGGFAGTWNGTTSLFNTDPTGGGNGTFFTTTNSSNSLIFSGSGPTGVINVRSGNFTVGSIDFANTAQLAAFTVGQAGGPIMSLNVTGNITDTGAGSADIRIINMNASNAATILTANSITIGVINFAEESFSNAQTWSTGYDMTMFTQFSLGRGNGNYTYTQTAGTVTVNDTTRGINFNPDTGSTSNTTSTRVHSYIMNGGQLQVGAIGVNTSNGGDNNTSNYWSSTARLEFNAGTIRTAAANGTLTIGNGLSFNTFNGTGTKDMQYNTSRPFTVALSQNGTHTLDANGASSTIIVNPGAQFVNKSGENGTLTKTGAGALVFTGGGPVAVNSYTGNTTVTAGLVSTDYNRIAGQAAGNGTTNLSNGYSAASRLVLDGGNYSLVGRGSAAAGNATGVTLAAGNAASALNVNVGSTAGLVIGQSVTNANLPTGSYIRRIIDGTTIELNAMSTNGTAAQTGQTLTFGAASFNNTQTINNVSVLQNATVTVTPGAGTSTTLLSFGNFTSTAGLTKAGSGTLQITGNVSHSGATAINAGTLEIASGTNATLSGNITGSGTFVKSGAGTTTINSTTAGGNIFSGAVIVNGGTLANGDSGRGLLSAASFTVNNGGTLSTLGSGLGFGNMAPLTVNAGGTFQVAFQNTGNVTLNGGTINGVGSFGGNNLALGANVTVGGSSASVIQGDARLALNTAANPAGQTRAFNVADATGNSNADLTISSVVHNAHVASGNFTGGNLTNLEKQGAGTMVLSGNNTYTGTTTVSAGTLLINGNSTAATGTMSVASGATLGGNGTIGGALSISGTLAPGNSPGNLIVNNSVTLENNSTFSIELNGTTVGTQYDRVTMTSGNFTLTGTNNLALTLGFTPALTNMFFVVDNQGSNAISGTFEQLNGVTTSLSQGDTFNIGADYFQISYTGNLGSNSFTGGNDLVLMSVVPEPSTFAMLALGVAGCLILNRRKKIRSV